MALSLGRNICHGSDSAEAAKEEINLWFKENEIATYASADYNLIYEK